MGVSIKDILTYKVIRLTDLNDKKISIDSFNMIYQFLSSIRQPNGEQLKDSYGNITSHLKGLFNRLVYFKKNNIKAIFVFDGKAPDLKEKTREIRKEKKEVALKNLEVAKESGDLDEILKYSKEINYLDKKMIDDSIFLIELFGFPIVRALGEGEAQSAFMAQKKLTFASCSQDFDSLLFGAEVLIRNLSVSQKRKISGTSMYREAEIELYDLSDNLKNMNIDIDDLIVIGILCGTDFNPKGISGIGPKKALKLVLDYKKDYTKLFSDLKWENYFSYSWEEVFNIFKKYEICDNLNIDFKNIQKDKIKEFLKTFEFDENQIDRSLSSIKNIKTLNEFF